MDNTPNSPSVDSKNAKTMRLLGNAWKILIAFFAVIILWRVYGWSQGQENLTSILPPLGMIFVGLGALVRPRNRILSLVLTGIAVLLVVSSLVLMFMY